jgi:CheY-like chemotaxis protein
MERPMEKQKTSGGSHFSACCGSLAEHESPSLEPVAETSSPGKRILVVDDQKSIREILFHLLSGMGFHVTLAADGAQGWRRFQSIPCDLVLTDLHMPVMDGWGLVRRIKQASPRTPVVLLTGEGRERILEKVARTDIDSTLFKPFTLTELEETVWRVLGTPRPHRCSS